MVLPVWRNLCAAARACSSPSPSACRPRRSCRTACRRHRKPAGAGDPHAGRNPHRPVHGHDRPRYPDGGACMWSVIASHPLAVAAMLDPSPGQQSPVTKTCSVLPPLCCSLRSTCTIWCWPRWCRATMYSPLPAADAGAGYEHPASAHFCRCLPLVLRFPHRISKAAV